MVCSTARITVLCLPAYYSAEFMGRPQRITASKDYAGLPKYHPFIPRGSVTLLGHASDLGSVYCVAANGHHRAVAPSFQTIKWCWTMLHKLRTIDLSRVTSHSCTR